MIQAEKVCIFFALKSEKSEFPKFLCAFFCEIFVFCEKICNFAKRKIKTSWE